MIHPFAHADLPAEIMPALPPWAKQKPAKSTENIVFLAGSALTVLDQWVSHEVYGVPVKLLASTLALKAAAATSRLEGRLVTQEAIRDAYHLTPAGDARGPDGDLLAFWREGAGIRLSGKNGLQSLKAIMGAGFEDQIETLFDQAMGVAELRGPLVGSVEALRLVLMVDDRAERIACLLADCVLANALNWKSVLPITAQALTKSLLRDLLAGQGGEEKKASFVIQQHLLKTIYETISLAKDLTFRANALRAVAPRLRAKTSDKAVALFLTEDAIAPATHLSPFIKGTRTEMTPRAARRLCDRLIELGVVRELTGRSTFRLYGV